MPTLAIRPIDEVRLEASKRLDPARRSQLGQFMTPTAIADFMASLFTFWPKAVRLLDPGAGVGSLTESFVSRFLLCAPTGASIEAHCYEIEPLLERYLSDHLRSIEARCEKLGRAFSGIIQNQDFIAEACFEVGMGAPRFTHAILNPPYKKISTDSAHRKMLQHVGIETVNLYTAFLGLAIAMLEHGGELVAIVPRSFCNGVYYRPFRKFLLERGSLTHIHVFESRTRAFKDDEVLQENIIIRFVRGTRQGAVLVSVSHDQSFSDQTSRETPFAQIVKPGDPERFIHVPTEQVTELGSLFSHTLSDLGLEVSTGPVVDFRLKEHCLAEPKGKCVPLLYAHHFRGGKFSWPTTHKKPNALRLNEATHKWLFPQGCYVLTKRFSAKEERRRVVAYVIEPEQLSYELFGFENHLNVFHQHKQGLPSDLAHGLGLFLNSTTVDRYFRNFSGHTQVNATDLRAMRYPSREMLVRFGQWARAQQALTQEEIDLYIEGENGG